MTMSIRLVITGAKLLTR